MSELVVVVYGVPAPQGSKRHVGHGILVESSKKLRPWRDAVRWTTADKTREQAWTPARGAAYRLDVTSNVALVPDAVRGPIAHATSSHPYGC